MDIWKKFYQNYVKIGKLKYLLDVEWFSFSSDVFI